MNRHVAEFAIFTCRSKEQTAAAHITAADEILGKHELLSKAAKQDIAVLCRRNASEENHGAVDGEITREGESVSLQRTKIPGISSVDIDGAEGEQIARFEEGVGIEQTAIGGDDANLVAAMGIGEMSGIGQFSAEVETAGEGKNFSQRQASLMKGLRGRERRFRIQK